jgi:DNA polymerase V
MHILGQKHKIDIYSIDEAFIDFSGIEKMNTISEAIALRSLLAQQLGLPVSVGIGPTKTLAKLGAYLAKKILVPVIFLETIFDALKIEDVPLSMVWGVGPKTVERLIDLGINSCSKFISAPSNFILKNLGSHVLRTQRELMGISCIHLCTTTEKNETISSTRTFKNAITTIWPLRNAFARFAMIACEKMRRQSGVCQALSLFIETDRFQQNFLPLTGSITLAVPTNNTSVILKNCESILTKLFREGLKIKRAGITLYRIQTDIQRQLPIFDASEAGKGGSDIIDTINQRFGRDAAYLGTLGVQAHQEKCLNLQQYTRKWSDLMVVS